MTNNLSTTITRLFSISLFLLVTAGLSIAQETASGNGLPHKLVGTWDSVVTIRNCATGDAIRSFQSVGSFNEGGTFSGITSGTPPTARTSERGIWEQVRGRNYRFRFKAYLYNPEAVAIGFQIVTHDVRLSRNGESYVSAGTTQIFTLDGVEIGSGCSTAESTRMVID